mgnify:CR=1 FL=1
MYIDSNIFIFAAINQDELGERCRNIIKLIEERKISCAASYLIIDEIIWVLKKRIGKKDALKITRASLSLPIKWLNIDESSIIKMLDVLEETNIDPRDALHTACMINNGFSTILSEDKDFDKIKNIRRMESKEFLENYYSK